MITTDFQAVKEIARNCHPPFDANIQITQGGNPICAYHQNKELFSKEKDSLQKWGKPLPQLHYSNPDDILAQLGFVPNTIEIPDEVLQKLKEDSLPRGHLDNPGEMGHNGAVLD